MNCPIGTETILNNILKDVLIVIFNLFCPYRTNVLLFCFYKYFAPDGAIRVYIVAKYNVINLCLLLIIFSL